MNAATITQPHAAKDGSAVAVALRADVLGGEPLSVEPISTPAARATPVQIVLIVLGTIGFLYFARPVVLPVFLACVAGMTLKPLIRWLSCCHMPPALSAAIVLCLLVTALGVGFFQLGRPVQRGRGGGQQPGCNGRGNSGGTGKNPDAGGQRKPWHQFDPELDRNLPGGHG